MGRWLLFAAVSALAMAETPKERATRLENALLAPCCFAESVAKHNSESAVKMRLEIARSIQEGLSDEEIVGAYVRRYGARIVAPPMSPPGPWSIATPWAVTALGAVGVSLLIWKWRRQASAPAAGGPPIEIPDDWSD